jgi:hypothetical protein
MKNTYIALPDHISQRTHGSLELKLLKAKIEDKRLKAPLFNTKHWVKEFEAGLNEAWRLKKEEGRVEHIEVQHLQGGEAVNRVKVYK